MKQADRLAAERRREALNAGTLCRDDLEVVIDRDAHERLGVIVGIVVERKDRGLGALDRSAFAKRCRWPSAEAALEFWQARQA